MVFSVNIGEREGITSRQRERLAWLADHVVTEDGERGHYRPVVLGHGLLVTVNAENEADAQRVVAAVLGRKPTELTATARDWVPTAAADGTEGRIRPRCLTDAGAERPGRAERSCRRGGRRDHPPSA